MTGRLWKDRSGAVEFKPRPPVVGQMFLSAQQLGYMPAGTASPEDGGARGLAAVRVWSSPAPMPEVNLQGLPQSLPLRFQQGTFSRVPDHRPALPPRHPRLNLGPGQTHEVMEETPSTSGQRCAAARAENLWVSPRRCPTRPRPRACRPCPCGRGRGPGRRGRGRRADRTPPSRSWR
jgi:hypothetical protein